MGKSIWTAFAFGPLIGAAVWQGAGDSERRKGERLASSDFEKSLGDLDVAKDTADQLKGRIRDVGWLKMSFTEAPGVAQSLVRALQDPGPSSPLPGAGDCVAAFKMAYGIGAREGIDQLGFRKWYRPFVRVIGKTTRVQPAHRVLWSDVALVFGKKGYLGSDADADRVPQGELSSAFQELIPEIVDLVVKSLNGQPAPKSSDLVDTTRKDLEF